jgi:hypothetical protein
MVKELSEKQRIAIASKAYNDDILSLPLTYKDATEHTAGDTLADFIVLELIEGGGIPSECARVMRSAIEQLEKVAEAFEDIDD